MYDQLPEMSPWFPANASVKWNYVCAIDASMLIFAFMITSYLNLHTRHFQSRLRSQTAYCSQTAPNIIQVIYFDALMNLGRQNSDR